MQQGEEERWHNTGDKNDRHTDMLTTKTFSFNYKQAIVERNKHIKIEY